MTVISRTPKAFLALAMVGVPVTTALSAQELDPQDAQPMNEMVTTVTGSVPSDFSDFPDGPDIEGFISARGASNMQVTGADGANTAVSISEATEIRGKGGFLGLGSKTLAADALLNGLPVTVETVQWGDRLIAREVKFKNDDFETAAMIRSGTEQRFAEQDFAIGENTAAAEALRGRLGDIDKYNIKGTTNVYFDTGKWSLGEADQQRLCAAASEADATENALLLVVGYTDSVGSQEYNQVLSERRAGRVVNHLQQACDWEPWRMLTPTGMAEADPLASNDTEQGKAQNRRVSVNILVSKSVDGV